MTDPQERASRRILQRLREDAHARDRPTPRLASIERLVAACDAIERGDGVQIDSRKRADSSINPSNIEKYAKARLKAGASEWVGPTRVFISQDVNLRAYVRAREDERLKPLDKRTRPSQRQKDVEDGLALLPIEIRQIIRHDLEEGRLARRRLDLLSRGLRVMPGVDIDALLRGGAEMPLEAQARDQPALPAPAPSQAQALALTPREVDVLKALVGRLGNPEAMKRAGLEFDGHRVRMATAPRTAIVQLDEMAVLQRLAGLKA